MTNRFQACFSGVFLAFALATLSPATSHVGDRIYPFFEIIDENLVDVTDGRIDEWEELFGEPSLTALDFSFIPNPAASDRETDAPAVQYDPSNLDFRIWLGWNDASEHIYVAAIVVDDRFFGDSVAYPDAFLFQDRIELFIEAITTVHPKVTKRAIFPRTAASVTGRPNFTRPFRSAPKPRIWT